MKKTKNFTKTVHNILNSCVKLEEQTMSLKMSTILPCLQYLTVRDQKT